MGKTLKVKPLKAKPCVISIMLCGAISVSIALGGCKNNEEKARELHNKAITANRENRADDAVSALEEIVKKYPSTQTAIEANQMLAASEAIDSISKDSVKEAIESALQLYYLDNGQYPSTEQGLQALVTPPTVGHIPRKWREGGYIENESLLDTGLQYELEGSKPKITFK